MRAKRGSGTFARRMEEALAPLLFLLFVILPLYHSITNPPLSLSSNTQPLLVLSFKLTDTVMEKMIRAPLFSCLLTTKGTVYYLENAMNATKNKADL